MCCLEVRRGGEWDASVVAVAVAVFSHELVSGVEDAVLRAYRVAENQPIECYVRFVDQDGKPVSRIRTRT